MALAHHARQFFLRVSKVAVHDGWWPYVLHRRRRHALKRRGDVQWARWRLMRGMIGLLRRVLRVKAERKKLDGANQERKRMMQRDGLSVVRAYARERRRRRANYGRGELQDLHYGFRRALEGLDGYCDGVRRRWQVAQQEDAHRYYLMFMRRKHYRPTVQAWKWVTDRMKVRCARTPPP